jgi:hypothetical protein
LGKRAVSKHHRKAIQNGGGNEPRNISYLPLKRHEQWNYFSHNDVPKAIAERINCVAYKKGFSVRLYYFNNGLKVRIPLENIKIDPNDTKYKKFCTGFDNFLGDMDIKKKIKVINSKYIDPDYVLDIREIKTKKKFKVMAEVGKKEKKYNSQIKARVSSGLSFRK